MRVGGVLRQPLASSLSIAAAFAPIMIDGALLFPEVEAA